MGASVKYLHRHPKTGRLSFRRAYPPDLRPHIPGQLVGAHKRKVRFPRSAGQLNVQDWVENRPAAFVSGMDDSCRPEGRAIVVSSRRMPQRSASDTAVRVQITML